MSDSVAMYDIPVTMLAGEPSTLAGYQGQVLLGRPGNQVDQWNFTTFLLARDGTVVDRFASTVKPEQLEPAIEGLCLSEPQS